MDAERHTLLKRASGFNAALRKGGLKTAGSASQIVPVVLGGMKVRWRQWGRCCSKRDLPYQRFDRHGADREVAVAAFTYDANHRRRAEAISAVPGGLARKTTGNDSEIRMRNPFLYNRDGYGGREDDIGGAPRAALDAVYWKPIQTGRWKALDRVTVKMRLAGIGTDRTLEEVYKFVPPVSPDLAARWAGVEIDLNRINPPTSLLNDWLIVEVAGGVLVPINGKQLRRT